MHGKSITEMAIRSSMSTAQKSYVSGLERRYDLMLTELTKRTGQLMEAKKELEEKDDIWKRTLDHLNKSC